MDKKNADQETKEFVVNDYITLKLENGKTEVYIAGEKFIQCRNIAYNLAVKETVEKTVIGLARTLENIDSIDELVDLRRFDILDDYEPVKISKETVFFVHCSNLQAWYEHDYDSRALHSNIAFPLLKKLNEIGDPLAKKRFKEEIMKRYPSGRANLVFYFQEEGHLNELSKAELQQVAIDSILNQNRLAIKYLIEGVEEDPDKGSWDQVKGLTLIERLNESEILNLIDALNSSLEKQDNMAKKIFASECVQNLVMKVVEEHFSGDLGDVRYRCKGDAGFWVREGPVVDLYISRYKGNPIKTFTEIFGFTHLKDLKSLELHGFDSPDMAGLESQKKLEKLNLNHNNINKIMKLEKMTRLKELKLNGNHIKDLRGLFRLKRLERLELIRNEIVELDGIGSLKYLKKLYLSNNSIINIERIRALTKLREIRLTSNRINDFTPLDDLKELDKEKSFGLS